jgi:hypothetical protein
MNNTQNNTEFNPIIKVIFIIGSILSLALNTNTGNALSVYYGSLPIYLYPLMAIIYAGCLFSILAYKKSIFVWITFVWIFLKDLIVYVIMNMNNSFIFNNIEKQIISNFTLVISISCLLLLKKDGKSAWRVILNNK